MKILGIETSCDETAASVVQDGRKILSHVLASSEAIHAKSGGVIPEVAAREQVRAIVPVISEALEKAKTHPNNSSPTHNSQLTPTPKIDAIAVTVGPGLIGSLLVGVETAKTLAYVWDKPIVPVNHLEAHIYANWLDAISDKKEVRRKEPEFPAVALVVSGGHTDMVLMRDHGKLRWLGGTRDDAAGEAFDKTARLLGLPYPGGPKIAQLAEGGDPNYYDLPRPMIDEENFDWSFSGLKTAVLRLVEKEGKNLKESHLAAGIQEAIGDVLVEKTLRAVKKYKPKSLLLAGGVAANKRLREKFEERITNQELRIKFFVPKPYLCTDNASYIAAYAHYNFKPIPWQKIRAQPGLTIIGET